MKKRILSFAIIFTMLSQMITTAFADGGIVIDNLKFENGKVIVPVTVDKAGESYSLLVIRKGGSSSQIEDRYAMDEKIAGDDLKVEFKFKIPETKNNLISAENPEGFTDGTYIITVKGNHSDKAIFEFDYVTESGKNQAMEKIMSAANADEIEAVLKPDSQQRIAYVNAGFDFTEYDKSDLQAEVSKIVFENLPESNENLSDVFNTAVVMAFVNDEPKNAVQYLENCDFSFEETDFTDADKEVKEWIGNVYAENTPFTLKSDFVATYAVANVLYKVMNAKFDTLDDILEAYDDILGIEASPEYKKYINLNDADTKATGETFVQTVNSAPVYSVKDLLTLLEKSITEADDKDNSNKYTGGGSKNSGFSGGINVTKSDEIDEIVVDDIVIPTVTDGEFVDLDSAEWAKDAVKYLYKKEIVSGVGEGKFNPNGVVTREAFAKMAVCAVDAYDASLKSDFTDVVSGSWYESYVASAAESGLVKGVGEGLFGVGNSITRQDVAVIIARCAEYMGISLAEKSDELFADDSEISDYAKESVYVLTASGIINGMGENTFAPKGNCTRAQAARLIYMLLTYDDSEKVEDTEDKEEFEQIEKDETVSKYSDKLRFLRGLGMFKDVSDDLFSESAVMLKGVFIKNAMRLVCGDETDDSNLIEKARDYGIGTSADYDYEGKISFDEAVAIIVRLSGIDALDSGLELNLVDRYKSNIARNTTTRGTEAITQGDIVNILYNAAHYEETVKLNADLDYELSDETILESKRDIRVVKGLVTDNGATSLDGESVIREDEVKIDGVTALQGISNAGDYLGQYVTAYIYFGKDENKVVYIEANTRNTTEIIVSADDIVDVDTSSRKIEFEDGDKNTTVVYSPIVKVIKNGRYFADYQKQDLLIKNGTLRFVDNDNDRKFDVIFIENYSFIVADGVLPTKNVIRNVYKEPASFDFYKVENYSIIYNGSKISLADVKSKDVLNILLTGTDYDDSVIIYVTREKATGRVTGIDAEEKTVLIDGVEYEYSDAYTDAAEYKDENGNGDSAFTAFELGKTYDIYLDKFGRVAYAEESKTGSAYEYVYATKMYDVEETEYTAMLKYFTLNSEWKKTEFADKVKYNGVSVKKEEIVKRAEADGFKSDVYRIMLNAQGKISSFEVAVETDDAKVFNKKTVSGIWSVNGFGMHNDVTGDKLTLLLDEDSKLFLVPESGNDEDYAIGNRSLLRSDQRLALTGYGLDEFGAADVSIYIKEEKISSSSTPVVVRRIEEALVDDEARQVLYGVSGSNNDYSIVAAKDGLFDGLNEGDLVVLATDAVNRAENVMVLCSPETQYGLKMGASVINTDNNTFVPGKFNVSTGFLAGFVTDINYTENKVKVDTGEAENQVIRTYHQNTSLPVYIYDMEEENLTSGKPDNIIKGDYVFMRTSWSKLTLVYVIRK